MACPYFYPVRRLGDAQRAPRVPLGDSYSGFCRVDPMRESRPDETTLRTLCNHGYARSKCPRFPSGDGPDAIRFTALAESGGTLSLYYVMESDHAPLAHGPLEYSLTESRFCGGNGGEMVRQQAWAYVESYLRRKTEPQNEANNPNRR